MILNKSSVERGAFHASMYKTETVDLRQDSKTSRFMADRSGGKRKEVRRCGGWGRWGEVVLVRVGE